MDITGSLPRIFRSKDLRAARQVVAEQQPYFFLNITSTRGIGRTTFLRSLKESYQDERPVAMVSVLQYEKKDSLTGYALGRFLHDIVVQLRSQEDVDVGEEDESLSVAALARKLLALVDKYVADEQTPLLFIDDYDQLPYGVRTVFEEVVFSRLFESGRWVMVILSSEQPLHFTNRLDLRMRRRHFPLKPLSAHDIERYVPEGSESLADVILTWTAGMPDLVDFLVQKTEELGIHNPEAYQERERELLGEEYRAEVRRVVFPDVRETTGDAIDVLALLRRFEVKVLSYVLPRTNGSTFAQFKQKDYLDLINALGSRVYWREQGGYALDNMLSGMLTAYLREFEPDFFDRVHQTTVEMYTTWLQEQFRPYYLLEMIHHEIELRRRAAVEEAALRTFVNQRISDYLEGEYGTLPDEVDGYVSLREALERDQELSGLVTEDTYKLIEAARDKAAERTPDSE
jgi:hypothetical protein